MLTAFVTGSSGYLGSHVCKELKRNNWKVVGLDIRRPNHTYLDLFVQSDVRNVNFIHDILTKVKPDVTFHFAGRIEVGLSFEEPTQFYDVNVAGTCNLLKLLKALNLNNIVYSSTAGLYEPKLTPIQEPDPKNWDNNPYAGSKFAAECAIRHSGLKHIIFRYFNLAGADPENDIGECHDPETHLIPKTLQNLNNVEIYGNDYNTPDGTCIRDYVHVSDVAATHLLAANHLLANGDSFILNLGTGKGHSVNEIVTKIQEITQQKITVNNLARRDGDPPILVADITLAEKILKYRPKHDIISILKTAHDWQNKQNGK